MANFFAGEDEDKNAQFITSIDLSHFDSSKVENIDAMFYQCSSLEEINFNNFNTSQIKSMTNTFDSCSNLKLLDLSNFDTSNVENMQRMFYGCSKLKSLDLSNFDTSNVEKMQEMFYNCENLEYLDISNFDTSKVQHSDSMLSGVNLLKYINLYNAQIDNINDAIKEIMKDSTIICQKDDFKIGEGITYIKECCEYNDNILKCFPENYITIQYNKKITYESGFQISRNDCPEFRKGINFIKNEENIITPTRKLEIKSNSKIEIHLDNSIQSLTFFFDSDCDENTKNIISIDFSHLDSSIITDMNSLFSGCNSLQKLDLNNLIINSSTSMENMFSGCNI